ncbi:MAG: hypothetical protein A2047_00920 [Omnitrophica bacterium GWA2_41_15]|nr:MAG: hypothetical protein A2047_00920 [Omnitrophica bacterium GWA2_41_15]
MAKGPPYHRTNQMMNEIKARIAKEKKELETDKFPHCRGMFDTCPTEQELNSLLERNLAPRRCGRCPVFHESKVKEIEVEPRKLTQEEVEELQKVFGKK